MSTLLDECRAAAPAWMAREGWEWDGDAADTRAGAKSSTCAHALLVVRYGRGFRVSCGPLLAFGYRLAPALAFVAGEVRAEMVARGLAEAEAEFRPRGFFDPEFAGRPDPEPDR